MYAVKHKQKYGHHQSCLFYFISFFLLFIYFLGGAKKRVHLNINCTRFKRQHINNESASVIALQKAPANVTKTNFPVFPDRILLCVLE